MAEKIRRDGRVHVLERTNLRYLSESEVPQKVDLVTLDLSFISILMVSFSTLLKLNFMAITFLRLNAYMLVFFIQQFKFLMQVMPAVVNVMKEESTLVALVKPQFEAGRSQVGA